MSKEIKDLKSLIKYYDNIFENKVAIAESIPIIPTDPNSSKYAFDELDKYSEMIFENLKELGMVRFNNFKTQFDLFIFLNSKYKNM